LLTNVLSVNYLTPDVAHALPELTPWRIRKQTLAPSVMARGSSRAAGCRRSPSFAAHRVAPAGEVMPWHFLGIPLGNARD